MSRPFSDSEAIARFPSLLDDAAAGRIIRIDRQADGAEFVLMSKATFIAPRPGLARYLADLDTGLSDRDSEEWLRAMDEVRGR